MPPLREPASGVGRGADGQPAPRAQRLRRAPGRAGLAAGSSPSRWTRSHDPPPDPSRQWSRLAFNAGQPRQSRRRSTSPCKAAETGGPAARRARRFARRPNPRAPRPRVRPGRTLPATRKLPSKRTPQPADHRPPTVGRPADHTLPAGRIGQSGAVGAGSG